jgi:ABC-2 type transport system ATP-binding protein
MSATITVDGVSHTFGRTRVLDGVDLELGPGVVGILGPNGAGKTTLLRMVATMLAPTAGRLRVLGHDLGDADGRLAVRRQLGYVPQEPGFYRHFTAFEFVDYVAILKELTDAPARHAEVHRVLDLVGLADVAGTRIRKLSGGMRRRVALAQALLGHPALLVLDEPTAGLDPEQRLRFREVVSTSVDSRTVLLSTHQTEDVAALCSRVVVLHDGRVRFDGAPAALTEQARGHVWVAPERDPSARLSWRTGAGAWRHVGDPPPLAQASEPTLEDAYLLLVGDGATREVAA